MELNIPAHIQSFVMNALQEEAQDRGKLVVAMKWARKQMSSFRTERRKVCSIELQVFFN